MKKVLVGLLALGSISAFAIPDVCLIQKHPDSVEAICSNESDSMKYFNSGIEYKVIILKKLLDKGYELKTDSSLVKLKK